MVRATLNWQLIKIRLNTISSESTDPIRVLKAVPRRVLAWLSTARTLRTIGIEFGLSTSQKSQFMHPDLISVKRYQNTEIHIRFYNVTRMTKDLPSRIFSQNLGAYPFLITENEPNKDN